MFNRTKLLDEGMTAALDGLPVESCPYPAGSTESESWVQGWYTASEDDDPERVPAVDAGSALLLARRFSALK